MRQRNFRLKLIAETYFVKTFSTPWKKTAEVAKGGSFCGARVWQGENKHFAHQNFKLSFDVEPFSPQNKLRRAPSEREKKKASMVMQEWGNEQEKNFLLLSQKVSNN